MNKFNPELPITRFDKSKLPKGVVALMSQAKEVFDDTVEMNSIMIAGRGCGKSGLAMAKLCNKYDIDYKKLMGDRL